MKNLTTNRGIAGLILCAFMAMIFFTPSTANAGWIDNSDDYPGTDGPSLGTVVLVGVAVGLAIGGLVLLSKGKKIDDDNIEADKTESSSEENESKSDSEQAVNDKNETNELTMLSLNQLSQSTLGLYLSCNNVNKDTKQKVNALDLSKLEIQAGLAFNF